MAHKRLGQLDLNLLYTFRTFAECGGVGQTAKALQRSQPAISARLHQLEDELGVQLFERAGRRLQLTPTGRAMYAAARPLLDSVHQILDRAWTAQEQPAGLVRIGTLTTVGVFLIAPVLSGFCETYPLAEVALDYGPTSALLTQLCRGQLDMVAGVGPPPSDNQLVVTILGDTLPVLTARAGCLPRGTVPPSYLCEQTIAAYSDIKDPFFDAVWSFFQQHQLEARVRLTVAHIQTLKTMVLTGTTVAILPDYTVNEATLETRRVQGLDFRQQIWMATRASARDVPVVAQLCKALCEYAARLARPTA